MSRSLVSPLSTTVSPTHLDLLRHLAALSPSPLYIMGGFVRDLLLGLPSVDFDLVIEADATLFANQVLANLGGRIVTHSKFRTATWTPPHEPTTEIDLVSARRETYAHPAALPDVTLSTLADDIRRRDFTLNTLALRLDGDHFGELFDLLNGEQDLNDKLIRILHPHSFIDDPTRLFRAVRYEQRYNFQIEPETLALIPSALPYIASLSGDRIRHELELILTEKESNHSLQRLEQLGILKAIHPALTVSKSTVTSFAALLAPLDPPSAKAISTRLNLPSKETELIQQVAESRALLKNLSDQALSLSQFHTQAKSLPPPALTLAAQVEALSPAQQTFLNTYLTRRASLRLHTNGQTIATLGLSPGPKYKEILFQLECAYLEGQITTAEEERAFLAKLISEQR
jgi:tRNA nucleotidyltransferase (CCA-adding enzyme)